MLVVAAANSAGSHELVFIQYSWVAYVNSQAGLSVATAVAQPSVLSLLRQPDQLDCIDAMA
jgi:hypothetical protein